MMNKFLFYFFSGMILLSLAACSTEDFEDQQSSDGQYVYELRLDGGVQDYGDATRAAKTWKNADVLYLRFSASSGIIKGKATYSSSKWTLTTDQALTGSGSCQAVEIDNAKSTTTSTVTLSPQSAIYEDKTGTWSLSSGNVLTVHVSLTPKTGRLRFKGTSGTSFSLTGLRTYTSYSISNGTFTQSQDAVSGSITSTGYSSYIYGLMANTSSPTLSTNGYTMECPTTMMQAGQSGWLNYPTATSHTGWTIPQASHAYVDLGLSVKWATCNVGAEKPEDYGDYYAWGETVTKSTYDWSTYKWCNGSMTTLTKYCTNSSYGTVDNKTTLDIADDVAHVKWGGSWRMPTKTEQDELQDSNNCTWSLTSQGGRFGYKVTSRKNGNSIFLPLAGYRYGSSFDSECSFYWSSTLASGSPNYTCNAWYLTIDSENVSSGSSNRTVGRSVRPVCP